MSVPGILPAAARTPGESQEELGALLAQLAELTRKRKDAEQELAAAETDERAALRDLATIDGSLLRLVGARADWSARQTALTQQRTELETAQTQSQALLAISESDDWTPFFAQRRDVEVELASLHRALAGVVDQLGAVNSEVAHWQVRADAAARRAGTARMHALVLSKRLPELQQAGERLDADIQARLETLQETLPAWLDDASRADLVSNAGGDPRELLDALLQGDAATPKPTTVQMLRLRGLPLWGFGPAPKYVPVGGTVVAPLLTAGGPVADAGREVFEVINGGQARQWVSPLAGPITTQYGSSTPYFPTHWAVDIGARLHTPVVAAAAGRVEFAGLASPGRPEANHGMSVVLRHHPRLVSVYCHMDAAAFAPVVHVGDEVAAGRVIGYVGFTGYSTGPHLHFEVRLDNRPIDPALVVPAWSR